MNKVTFPKAAKPGLMSREWNSFGYSSGDNMYKERESDQRRCNLALLELQCAVAFPQFPLASLSGHHCGTLWVVPPAARPQFPGYSKTAAAPIPVPMHMDTTP